MIEWIIAFCLLCLIVAQVMLIRGCVSLPLHMELQAQVIGSEVTVLRRSLDGGCRLLDELIQVVADSVPDVPTVAQPDHPLAIMLRMLMANSNPVEKHGNTQKPERPILQENDSPPSNTTQDESN